MNWHRCVASIVNFYMEASGECNQNAAPMKPYVDININPTNQLDIPPFKATTTIRMAMNNDMPSNAPRFQKTKRKRIEIMCI